VAAQLAQLMLFLRAWLEAAVLEVVAAGAASQTLETARKT